MKLLKSILNIGVLPEHSRFEARLIRAINILAGYAIISMIFATFYGYFYQNNVSSLYALLSLPFFFLVIYFNWINKSFIAITVLFISSALVLGTYSVRVGEASFTHSMFVLNLMGLALIYRNQKARFYFYLCLVFTLICIIAVLLIFHNNWFIEFRDPLIVPERDRELNFFMLILCSLIYMVVVVSTYQQQTKDIENSLDEQRVLLAEVNHRVKNNMAIIISLLNMQRNVSKEPETIEALQDVHDRIMSMALVHQKMYENKSKSSIELDTYINELIDEIRNSLDLNNNVAFETDIEAICMDVSTAIPLGLILNELITNAMKHAFKKIEHPKITISLKEVNAYSIELIVNDNGGEITLEKLKQGSGLGISLIQSLAEQIDGKYEFEIDKGLVFKLHIPYLSELDKSN